jgi:hypothetical protein
VLDGRLRVAPPTPAGPVTESQRAANGTDASSRASNLRATLGDVFRYLLKSPDGVLHKPGVVVTAVPFWSLAETLRLGNGELLRILAIDTEIHHALIEAGINGVFTVEPVQSRLQDNGERSRA